VLVVTDSGMEGTMIEPEREVDSLSVAVGVGLTLVAATATVGGLVAMRFGSPVVDLFLAIVVLVSLAVALASAIVTVTYVRIIARRRRRPPPSESVERLRALLATTDADELARALEIETAPGGSLFTDRAGGISPALARALARIGRASHPARGTGIVRPSDDGGAA
jgi:hypothetical protein